MILFSRKLPRDLREHWTQFVAVALMAALSVLIYSGLEGGWRGIQKELESVAATGHMPDAWITGLNITPEDVAELESLEGVTHVSLTDTEPVPVTDRTSAGEIELNASTDAEINQPQVVKRTPVDGSAGLWLDEAYAHEHNIAVGQRMHLRSDSHDADIEVKGLVILPDHLAYTGPGLVAPQPSRHGYGIVSPETLKSFSQAESPMGTLRILGDVEQLRNDASGILENRFLSFSDRESHPYVAPAFERVTQIQSISYLFSSLFVLVALLSMFTSIRRLTDMQRTEVATLKALGYTNRVVGLYFTVVGAVTVTIGTLAGLSLTPLLSRYVLGTQQNSFSLPAWQPSYTMASLALPALLLVVSFIASWSATRTVRRASPAEGMRPDQGKSKNTILDRRPGSLARLRYGTRWTIRDAAGNPVRVAMGIVATTGCMMLLMTGFGMLDTLNKQVQLSYQEQYRYDSRITLTTSPDSGQREVLEDETGEGQWIQQSSVELGEGQHLDHTLTVLDEGDLFRVLNTQDKPLELTDQAAVSRSISDRLGVAEGDSVEVSLPGEKAVRVQIGHITTVSEPQGIFISAAAWEDAGGRFQPNSFLTLEPVPMDVVDTPMVGEVIALDDQRNNAQHLVDGLNSVFTLIKVFAIILAMVVLYNLGALSFTERMRDYATLRVLGFHNGELRTLAGLENSFTTAVGWLIGLPAGWWFLSQYVGLFSTDRATYQPHLTLVSLVLASLITVIFAMTATLLLTRRIRRVDMTSALKGVE